MNATLALPLLALTVAVARVAIPAIGDRYDRTKYENALRLDPDHGWLRGNTCGVADAAPNAGPYECDEIVQFVGVDQSSDYYPGGWYLVSAIRRDPPAGGTASGPTPEYAHREALAIVRAVLAGDAEREGREIARQVTHG